MRTSAPKQTTKTVSNPPGALGNLPFEGLPLGKRVQILGSPDLLGREQHQMDHARSLEVLDEHAKDNKTPARRLDPQFHYNATARSPPEHKEEVMETPLAPTGTVGPETDTGRRLQENSEATPRGELIGCEPMTTQIHHHQAT